MAKILGIDPGLQKTGWGMIEQDGSVLRFMASGLIKTDAALPLPARLSTLHHGLCRVIEEVGGVSVGTLAETLNGQAQNLSAAMEETFVNRNPASALKLGQARGALLAVPGLYGIETAEYATNKVKKSVVGTGHADKNQIGAMVRMLLPGCGQISEDEADALAVAITHAHYSQAHVVISAKAGVF